MRSLNLLIITSIVSTMLIAAEDAQAQSQNSVLTPRSTSPLEIARVINRASRSRMKNYVEVDLSSTWKSLAVDSGDFAECSYCEAKIFVTELDGQPGQEVILKLTRSLAFCRYLIFSRRGRAKWKFLGYIDHDFNKYQLSRHWIGRALGRNWLVVRGQEGSGSGYSLYSETWYQINDKGVRPVLNYPVEGNTYPWPNGLGRKFKAHVVNMRRKNNEIRVRYRVTYTILDYVRNEFSQFSVNHHDTYYVWKNKNHTFLFDKRRAGVSENEIDIIAGIETENESPPGMKIGSMTFYSQSGAKAFVGGGYEVFLKYNFPRLMRIATARDEKKKEWLKQFLNDCENTSEKRALLQVLTK